MSLTTYNKIQIPDIHETKKAALEELDQEMQDMQNKIDEQTEQLNKIKDKIEDPTIKEKLKRIFKKYGFTVVAVLAAVGAIIGVIISNLKSGLSALGKGLQTLGKKLAGMLPGMIGSIASFIFKSAGEAVKYLAKNAWLVIVAVVIYAINQLKKKTSK